MPRSFKAYDLDLTLERPCQDPADSSVAAVCKTGKRVHTSPGVLHDVSDLSLSPFVDLYLAKTWNKDEALSLGFLLAHVNGTGVLHGVTVYPVLI